MGCVLTVFFASVSVVLFVKNNVSKMIGDITGWNAKIAMLQKKKHRKALVQNQTLLLTDNDYTECLKKEEEVFFQIVEDIMIVHTEENI